MFRATGDHIRYQLAAATLLFRAGDLRAAESTLHDALSRCEHIDSPLAGAGRVSLARLRRADGNQAGAEALAHQGLAEIDSAGLRPELPDALEVLGTMTLQRLAVAVKLTNMHWAAEADALPPAGQRMLVRAGRKPGRRV
jgi:hypothetical protein